MEKIESTITTDFCRTMLQGLVRDVTQRFGDKWSLAVLATLFDGPLRFGELQSAVGGIAHRVLTSTLRSLERDGLVHREEFDEMPRRVVYCLTDLGRSLGAPLSAISMWSDAHQGEVVANRLKFDATVDAHPRGSKMSETARVAVSSSGTASRDRRWP